MLDYIKLLRDARSLLTRIDTSTKEKRYQTVSLLKAIHSSVDKSIKQLEAELRRDAEKGIEGCNESTAWRESQVGDVIARKYADKTESVETIDGADSDNIKQLLDAKDISHRMVFVESVDLNRLKLLLDSGFISESEYESVLYRSTKTEKTTGKFTIVNTGLVERAVKASIDELDFILQEAQNVADKSHQLELFNTKEKQQEIKQPELLLE